MPRIFLPLALSSFALAGCATPASHATHPELADGTYRITICKGNCQADPKAVTGVLVLDRTRKAFANQSEAMMYLMRADSATFAPNYCYYFDPQTSNSGGTLFEYDIVSFGNLRKDPSGPTKIAFMIDSPDFRFISSIEAAGDDRFRGDWSSSYAGDGGAAKNSPGAHLWGEKVSEPDAAVCFNAIRQHERSSLKAYCDEFPARSCEPGDSPGVPTPEN